LFTASDRFGDATMAFGKIREELKSHASCNFMITRHVQAPNEALHLGTVGSELLEPLASCAGEFADEAAGRARTSASNGPRSEESGSLAANS
jgi:hypothetical protein